MVTRHFIPYLTPVLFTLTATGFAQDGPQQGDPDKGPPASVLQEKVREWVRAQKQRGKELADWQEQRSGLARLNEIRRKEIAEIDTLIEAAGKRLEEATAQREQLLAEQAGLRIARAQLSDRIGTLEEALAGRLPMFPEALREKVPDAIARLENPDDSRPLQDRYRDLVAILAAATEFGRSLNITSELREIGGEQVEVEVLYSGFSGAWYVSRGGDLAGTGSAGVQGWSWVEDNSIADRVRTAIDMHRKERAPGYVRLPFAPSHE